MIYTVTFNPALDYVVKVDHLRIGSVNRSCQEEIFYGGKGINVSAVLKELGYSSTALGFVAGFTGDELERGVKELGFSSDFIHVKNGMTRINVKLKSEQETEINGIGPEIEETDVERLFERFDKLEAGDVLILSGSIPNSLDDQIYEKIMERMMDRNIMIAVDATKDLLCNVLKYHPFLIKPNNHELGEMFDTVLKTPEEIVIHAKKLQEMGALNVLVSMAGDGAILAAEDGTVHRLGVPKGTVLNSVGAGDSMVAGFMAGCLDKKDYEYALKLGTAAGSATAFSEGLAKRKDIIEILQNIQ